MLEEGYKRALAALKVLANSVTRECAGDRKALVEAQNQMAIYEREYQEIVRLVITKSVPVVDLDESTLSDWLKNDT